MLAGTDCDKRRRESGEKREEEREKGEEREEGEDPSSCPGHAGYIPNGGFLRYLWPLDPARFFGFECLYQLSPTPIE
jgi:hypothetical protein